MYNYYKYYEDKILNKLSVLDRQIASYPDEPEKFVLLNNFGAVLVAMDNSQLQNMGGVLVEIINYKVYVIVKEMRKTSRDYEDVVAVVELLNNLNQDGIFIEFKGVGGSYNYENKQVFELIFEVTHYWN